MITKILTSRTVWTAVLLFVVAGVHGITGFIPAQFVTPIEGFLTFLTIYFKVNPSQQY